MHDERFAAVVTPILHAGRLDDSHVARDVSRYLAARCLLDAARADGWAALPPPHVQPAWRAMLYSAAVPCDAGPDDAMDRAYQRAERAAIRAAGGMPETEDDGTAEQGDGYRPPFLPTDLERSGLFRAGGFVHHDNRLCIPWRAPSGMITTLQRRRLDDGKPKYVFPAGRSPEWPYGVERVGDIPSDTPVVFVEGAVDVLALRAILAARGEPALVLGLPGVGAWRPEWAPLARGRLAAIAVDADAAGERVVDTMRRDLYAAGAQIVERWTPPSHDWAQSIAEAA